MRIRAPVVALAVMMAVVMMVRTVLFMGPTIHAGLDTGFVSRRLTGMKTKREARAIATLAAASAEHAAVVEKWAGRPKPPRGEADREITAAYNALQGALWPFLSGEYPMPPEGAGFGL